MQKSLVTMQTTFRMQLRQSMNKLMLLLSADKEEEVVVTVVTEVDINNAALAVKEKADSGQEVRDRFLKCFFSLLTLCVDEPAGDRNYGDRQSGGYSRDN